MLGYTFAFVGIVAVVLLFVLFRLLGGTTAKNARGDYNKGTTYEKPVEDQAPVSRQANEPNRPASRA